ncbi:MAG: hypothetical protein M3477_04700 [Gemmatimonadota bacterium]|nr:hypothetical protein [Gemmatimonadota bacterium]
MSTERTADVELVYFTGCPHVEAARRTIRGALALEQLPLVWREWNQHDPAAPARVQRYGSPTVLVGGQDVTGAAKADAAACRADGIPAQETIRAAVRTATARPPHDSLHEGDA